MQGAGCLNRRRHDKQNMLPAGKGFFVTPSDSVALIASSAAEAIPYFKGGLKAKIAEHAPLPQVLTSARMAACCKLPADCSMIMAQQHREGSA